MSIEINGKVYRNLQEQVEKNKEDIEVLDQKIPEDIDYDDIKSLRIEAVQKLKSFRPSNIGQASRIAGVSPADISVLHVYLEQMRRKQNE